MPEDYLAELREEREAARRAFEVSIAIDSQGGVEFAKDWYRDVAAEIAAEKGCRAATERVATDGGEEPGPESTGWVAWCDEACGRLGSFQGEPAARTKAKSHRVKEGHDAYAVPRADSSSEEVNDVE